MRIRLLTIAVCIQTGLLAQNPNTSVQATVYNTITSASTLDGAGYIDNRSQFIRRNNSHSYRAYGTGSWQVDMQWADTTPTVWTSYGSTAVVTNASPSSAIGYGLDPTNSGGKSYHDFIRFVFTGTATVQNYFGTKNVWLPPSVASISFPITGNQGGTSGLFYPDVFAGTFALGCSGAISAGLTLLVTQPWTALTTQSCAANIAFLKGGSLQPASAQVITLTGTVSASAFQIFDYSASGTVILPGGTTSYPQWFSGASDTVRITEAIAATKSATGGTVYLNGTISKTATIPAYGLSANQSVNVTDARYGVTPASNARFGSYSVHPEARDNSGGYASEFNVMGLQNPGVIANTLSNGTATGYSTANYTTSFCHAALGNSTWCMVTDLAQKGSLGTAYRDWGVYNYVNGGTGTYGFYVGVDGNIKNRFDFAPSNFVQSTPSITSCSTATPMLVTFATPHNIIGTNVPISIAGSANTTCNGVWKAVYSTANALSLVNSTGPGSGSTGSGTATFSAGQQRATVNVPRIQGGLEALYVEGVNAEYGVTFAQLSGALYPGSHVHCTDCDVPLVQGSPCTSNSNKTGAYVFYENSVASCFGASKSTVAPVIYPEWWGAIADWNGSTGTDNRTAFNSAISAAQSSGATLAMACGSYYVSASLTINVQVPFTWSGCSAEHINSADHGSYLIFNSGGIVLSGYAQFITLQNFGIRALPSAGPNLSIGGNSGRDDFINLNMVSENAAQPLIDADAGASGDLDALNFDGMELTPAAGHSVPAIYFHTSGGVVTPVRFSNRYSRQWTGSATASAPFFKADNGGLATFQLFTFENILSEVTPAGLFDFNGVTNVLMNNVVEADSTMTVPVVKITARATWPIGQYTFINSYFADGSASTTNPSLLVDIGSSTGLGRISATGGEFAHTRIVNNTSGASVLMTNVRTSDLYDITEVSTVQVSPSATLAQGAGLGLNTSSMTGRLSLMSLSGQSPITAKCVTASDLAVDSSDTHKVTSASWTAVSDDVGSYLYTYSGTGFAAGFGNQIIAVSGGAAFLKSAVGTAGSTSGVFSVSRGMIGYQWNRNTPGNSQDELVACSANADSTVTQKTLPQTIPAIAFASLPTVNKPTFAIITNSNTTTWGATISAASPGSAVLAYWNGSNWTVMAK